MLIIKKKKERERKERKGGKTGALRGCGDVSGWEAPGLRLRLGVGPGPPSQAFYACGVDLTLTQPCKSTILQYKIKIKIKKILIEIKFT